MRHAADLAGQQRQLHDDLQKNKHRKDPWKYASYLRAPLANSASVLQVAAQHIPEATLHTGSCHEREQIDSSAADVHARVELIKAMKDMLSKQTSEAVRKAHLQQAQQHHRAGSKKPASALQDSLNSAEPGAAAGNNEGAVLMQLYLAQLDATASLWPRAWSCPAAGLPPLSITLDPATCCKQPGLQQTLKHLMSGWSFHTEVNKQLEVDALHVCTPGCSAAVAAGLSALQSRDGMHTAGSVAAAADTGGSGSGWWDEEDEGGEGQAGSRALEQCLMQVPLPSYLGGTWGSPAAAEAAAGLPGGTSDLDTPQHSSAWDAQAGHPSPMQLDAQRERLCGEGHGQPGCADTAGGSVQMPALRQQQQQAVCVMPNPASVVLVRSVSALAAVTNHNQLTLAAPDSSVVHHVMCCDHTRAEPSAVPMSPEVSLENQDCCGVHAPGGITPAYPSVIATLHPYPGPPSTSQSQPTASASVQRNGERVDVGALPVVEQMVGAQAGEVVAVRGQLVPDACELVMDWELDPDACVELTLLPDTGQHRLSDAHGKQLDSATLEIVDDMNGSGGEPHSRQQQIQGTAQQQVPMGQVCSRVGGGECKQQGVIEAGAAAVPEQQQQAQHLGAAGGQDAAGQGAGVVGAVPDLTPGQDQRLGSSKPMQPVIIRKRTHAKYAHLLQAPARLETSDADVGHVAAPEQGIGRPRGGVQGSADDSDDVDDDCTAKVRSSGTTLDGRPPSLVPAARKPVLRSMARSRQLTLITRPSSHLITPEAGQHVRPSGGSDFGTMKRAETDDDSIEIVSDEGDDEGAAAPVRAQLRQGGSSEAAVGVSGGGAVSDSCVQGQDEEQRGTEHGAGGKAAPRAVVIRKRGTVRRCDASQAGPSQAATTPGHHVDPDVSLDMHISDDDEDEVLDGDQSTSGAAASAGVHSLLGRRKSPADTGGGGGGAGARKAGRHAAPGCASVVPDDAFVFRPDLSPAWLQRFDVASISRSVEVQKKLRCKPVHNPNLLLTKLPPVPNAHQLVQRYRQQQQQAAGTDKTGAGAGLVDAAAAGVGGIIPVTQASTVNTPLNSFSKQPSKMTSSKVSKAQQRTSLFTPSSPDTLLELDVAGAVNAAQQLLEAALGGAEALAALHLPAWPPAPPYVCLPPSPADTGLSSWHAGGAGGGTAGLSVGAARTAQPAPGQQLKQLNLVNMAASGQDHNLVGSYLADSDVAAVQPGRTTWAVQVVEEEEDDLDEGFWAQVDAAVQAAHVPGVEALPASGPGRSAVSAAAPAARQSGTVVALYPAPGHLLSAEPALARAPGGGLTSGPGDGLPAAGHLALSDAVLPAGTPLAGNLRLSGPGQRRSAGRASGSSKELVMMSALEELQLGAGASSRVASAHVKPHNTGGARADADRGGGMVGVSNSLFRARSDRKATAAQHGHVARARSGEPPGGVGGGDDCMMDCVEHVVCVSPGGRQQGRTAVQEHLLLHTPGMHQPVFQQHQPQQWAQQQQQQQQQPHRTASKSLSLLDSVLQEYTDEHGSRDHVLHQPRDQLVQGGRVQGRQWIHPCASGAAASSHHIVSDVQQDMQQRINGQDHQLQMSKQQGAQRFDAARADAYRQQPCRAQGTLAGHWAGGADWTPMHQEPQLASVGRLHSSSAGLSASPRHVHGAEGRPETGQWSAWQGGSTAADHGGMSGGALGWWGDEQHDEAMEVVVDVEELEVDWGDDTHVQQQQQAQLGDKEQQDEVPGILSMRQLAQDQHDQARTGAGLQLELGQQCTEAVCHPPGAAVEHGLGTGPSGQQEGQAGTGSGRRLGRADQHVSGDAHGRDHNAGARPQAGCSGMGRQESAWDGDEELDLQLPLSDLMRDLGMDVDEGQLLARAQEAVGNLSASQLAAAAAAMNLVAGSDLMEWEEEEEEEGEETAGDGVVMSEQSCEQHVMHLCGNDVADRCRDPVCALTPVSFNCMPSLADQQFTTDGSQPPLPTAAALADQRLRDLGPAPVSLAVATNTPPAAQHDPQHTAPCVAPGPDSGGFAGFKLPFQETVLGPEAGSPKLRGACWQVQPVVAPGAGLQSAGSPAAKRQKAGQHLAPGCGGGSSEQVGMQRDSGGAPQGGVREQLLEAGAGVPGAAAAGAVSGDAAGPRPKCTARQALRDRLVQEILRLHMRSRVDLTTLKNYISTALTQHARSAEQTSSSVPQTVALPWNAIQSMAMEKRRSLFGELEVTPHRLLLALLSLAHQNNIAVCSGSGRQGADQEAVAVKIWLPGVRVVLKPCTTAAPVLDHKGVAADEPGIMVHLIPVSQQQA